jgi:hypothetical protein
MTLPLLREIRSVYAFVEPSVFRSNFTSGPFWVPKILMEL